MKQLEKSHEFLTRLLCTMGVLAIFLIGRNILLYGVDIAQYKSSTLDMQNLMINMLSGDMYRCSIFALGIMPYMTVSIVVQIVTAFLPQYAKKKITQTKTDNATLLFTFFYTAFMAYSHASELSYLPSTYDINTLRLISTVEMTFFTMALVFLVHVNKDHGIGQQTPIIMVNVIEGIYSAVYGNYSYITATILMIGIVIMIITIIMENVDLRIPVQRISIHNIYSDKNYIAFKLNPIGIMPVMFSTSIFVLIKYLMYFIGGIFPENSSLMWFNAHMDLADKTGVGMYLLIIFLFTILFSFVMLQPKTLAENLQKVGDSIIGVYAGRPTVHYLRIIILLLSILSGIVLSSCMGVSMFIGLENSIPQALALLPSSLMILIGIINNLVEEIKGYLQFDSYRFFM